MFNAASQLLHGFRQASRFVEPACKEEVCGYLVRGQLMRRDEMAFGLPNAPQLAVDDAKVRLKRIVVRREREGSFEILQSSRIVPFGHLGETVVHEPTSVPGTLDGDIEPKGLVRRPYPIARPRPGGKARSERRANRHNQHPFPAVTSYQKRSGISGAQRQTNEREEHPVVIFDFCEGKQGSGQRGNQKPAQTESDWPEGSVFRPTNDDGKKDSNE